MKILFMLFNLFLLVSTAFIDVNCPGGIRVRKEFRDMTLAEWSAFRKTIIAVYSQNDKMKSIIDYWTKVHLNCVPDAHNTPQFFPWHRYFLKIFEDQLRTINPNVTIPYWDWSYDAKSSLKSPIFKPKYLGFVKLGSQGDCNFILAHPNRHCLTRNYVAHKFPSFHDTKTMQKLIQRQSKFSQFSELIESAPHGLLHFVIGGKKGDFSGMMSPNDPFFWLHHAYLDKVWHDWQMHSPSRFSQYNGKHRGHQVNMFDRMAPWKLPIHSTFNITELCYHYQPFSKLAGSKPQPLPVNPPNKAPIAIQPISGLPTSTKSIHNSSNNDVPFATKTPSNGSVNNSRIHSNLFTVSPNDATKIHLQSVTESQQKFLVDGDLVDVIDESSSKSSESPIPDEWIKHHGLDVKKFRENEHILIALANEDVKESKQTTTNSSFSSVSCSYKNLFMVLLLVFVNFI